MSKIYWNHTNRTWIEIDITGNQRELDRAFVNVDKLLYEEPASDCVKTGRCGYFVGTVLSLPTYDPDDLNEITILHFDGYNFVDDKQQKVSECNLALLLPNGIAVKLA